MKLINIGFGNMVCANRLVAIVSPESAPIDLAVFPRALADEMLLEHAAEIHIFLVDLRELLLADDARERPRVLHPGVGGEKLVGAVGVVGAGEPFADAVLHQAGEGGQH